MNKLSNIVFALTSVMLLFSCTEKSETETGGRLVEKTFTAVANPSGAATKTTLGDDNLVNFSDGESVLIYDGEDNREFVVSGDGNLVTISGEVSETATTFYALTPYTEDATFTSTDGVFSTEVSLASAQEPVIGTFADGVNIAAAKTTDQNTFEFTNVLSFAKITIDNSQLGDHKIASVKLTSTNYQLAGDVKVAYTDTPTATAGTSTVKEVSLSNADGSAFNDGSYIFTLIPNEGGEITLTFTDTDGNTATKTATLGKPFTAGVVKNLGTVRNLTWTQNTTTTEYSLFNGQLEEGDYVIVYAVDNSNGAINSTVSKNRLQYTDVNIIDNKVVDPDATVIWHIAPSSDGNYWTIRNTSTGTYAASTSSKNKAQLLSSGTDDKSLWSVTSTSSSTTYDFVNKSNSRYLRRNGNYGFACYSQSTGGALTLYKATTSKESASTTVTTANASSITTTTAVLNGSYKNAAATPTEAGFYWSTSSSALEESNLDNLESSGNVLQYQGTLSSTSGSFSQTLDNLGGGTAGITYYYRAYIMVYENGDVKYYYGSVKSFTTHSESSGKGGWYELPYMDPVSSGQYTISSSNLNNYYATHMCAGGETYTYNGKSVTARNYTVCYSAEKHCAWWVAAPRHKMYEGNSGRSEAYGVDTSIPSNVQYTSSKRGSTTYNRGHLLGSQERTCSKATNAQVFKYSNIAPQIDGSFNGGGGAWNELEKFVDKQVCSDTLYEVIGCYYEDYKDGYGKSANKKTISYMGRNDVGCPTMFYYALCRTKSGNSGKALKDCTADEIKCVAFVRAHSAELKGQKVTSKELMSISDLEALTGFTYFVNVPNAPKSTFTASDWGL